MLLLWFQEEVPEVSAVGQPWSTCAYLNQYLEGKWRVLTGQALVMNPILSMGWD